MPLREFEWDLIITPTLVVIFMLFVFLQPESTLATPVDVVDAWKPWQPWQPWMTSSVVDDLR